MGDSGELESWEYQGGTFTDAGSWLAVGWKKLAELDISNNTKFNSIIGYIKVYGNVRENSKIKIAFYDDRGSDLSVDGVRKGAYRYTDEWAVNKIIEHTYTDVTIKFVPKEEAISTGAALLNNNITLEYETPELKNNITKLGTEITDLETEISNIKISDDTKFNETFQYFEIYGDLNYSDKIEFTLYDNGGSDLYVNGVSKGVYKYPWEVGKEQSHTYNDVKVIFLPIKEPYSSAKIKLNNNVVLFGFREQINDFESVRDKLIISNDENFNSFFNYVYVYGNVSYRDKIKWSIWSNAGSELKINDEIRGSRSIGDSWIVGNHIVAKYTDVFVVFSPAKEASIIGSSAISAELINSSVMDISAKLLQDVSNIKIEIPDIGVAGSLKFACFGDSITSNQVSNIGGLIRQKLGINFLQQSESDIEGVGNVTTEFGNLAVGWSTMTDVYLEDGGDNKSTIYLLKSANVSPQDNPYNVLSNQIRRLIAHTTPLGEQISWTVQSDGSTTKIPVEYGAGKGYTEDIPDIIYIASGINDTTAVGVKDLILKDNFDEVIAQNYADLKRDTMYSALRWAIETLQNVYPRAIIFVATPLYTTFNSDSLLTKKCEIIKKMCEYMRVKIIDSNMKCGINPTNADTVYGGLHPNDDGKEIVSSFVTGQIRGNCNIL